MKPLIKPAILGLAILSAPGFQIQSLAQGSLTPPGAPAPTFKTLTQIEPRTAITSTGATTISTSGSYYLANNITVSSGDAVTIAVNNVTLDLNGFTISSTASPAAGTGIEVGNRTGITITNGNIVGGVTNSGTTFSGNGFINGIRSAIFTSVREIRVSGIVVRGCLGEGIFLNDPIGRSTVVDSCLVDIAGGTGIGAGHVLNSIATNCGFEGISATVASHCRGSSVGTGDGVTASIADHCVGDSAGGNGIEATQTLASSGSSNSGNGILAYVADNCYGSSSSGKGILAYNTAVNCYATSSTGNGLDSAIARGCYATSFSGNGLAGTTVESCYGSSSSGGTGLSATNALNCQGTATGSGIGLSAVTAENCSGSSTGSGTGLFVTRIANSCQGTSGTGTGLAAGFASLSSGGVANNCYGTGASGLFAFQALNCYGHATGGGSGISATSASNCRGQAVAGSGVGATTAQNCYGYTTGAGTGISASMAIGCWGQSTANGTGLSAEIANSSKGVSFSGTPVSVTNKYDMP